MIHNKLLHVHNTLRDNGIMISFSGRLSQGLIEEYGAAVKSYLEIEERPQNEIFHVFSIFIEQTQNIKNYCSLKKDSSLFDSISQSCIVTIGKSDSSFFICSGNLIDNADLPRLTSRIKPLLAMDKAELKLAYKEALRRPLAEHESPGIGLIDIARKATRPLEYAITAIDGQLSFFTLKALV